MSNLLTIQQVAERLSCQPDLVRTHITTNRLRATNIGAKSQKIWRISEEDLAAFIASQANEFQPKVVFKPPSKLRYLKG